MSTLMHLVLAVAGMLLQTSICYAQDDGKKARVDFGTKGGITASLFSASINAESRPRFGPSIGFFLKAGERIRFCPEMIYSNQRQQDNYLAQPGGPSVGYTTTSTHYLHLPLLFEVGNKISFHFGPQLSVLLGGSEKGTVRSNPVNSSLRKVMRNTDFGFVFGMEVRVVQNLNAGIRVSVGVVDIYKADEDQKIVGYPVIQNRAATLFVAYSFN